MLPPCLTPLEAGIPLIRKSGAAYDELQGDCVLDVAAVRTYGKRESAPGRGVAGRDD